MKNIRLAIEAVNAQADATGALYNGGYLECYNRRQLQIPTSILKSGHL
jgi:hypothetical protein